ncbi:transposase InsO family protein [Arthrobacter sp. B1I2]|nr:transposase InsO family protein [Arthrobacter sp. B1I2]
MDIKKLGRIPGGGGPRAFGRAAGWRNRTGSAANRRPGYHYLHNAVDDRSRLAYTEILSDEKKETAAGFWERANAFFESRGVSVKRVLTDNGPCYRSHAFKDALGPDIKHKYTRPYRPQTNGKVERYNRTLLDEWAYARPYQSEAERVAAFPAWLHHYNHHRGHTSLQGQPPASRVTNLSGQYS